MEYSSNRLPNTSGFIGVFYGVDHSLAEMKSFPTRQETSEVIAISLLVEEFIPG